MNTKTEIAYLAGMFDGEGWISIQVQPTPAGRSHVLIVGLSNTNREVLEWIKERWGGHFGTIKKHDDAWQQCYRVTWGWGKAAEILTEIQPFLIVKREAAAVGIAFAARKTAGRRDVTPEEWEAREDLRLALKATSLRAKKVTGYEGRLPYPKSERCCERCGLAFHSRNRTRRFCGQKCQMAVYYKEHPEKFRRCSRAPVG